MKLKPLQCRLALLAVYSLFAACRAETARHVLALFDDASASKEYSQFLKNIEELGYSVSVRDATAGDLHLRSWDNWQYDRLIIFSSGTKGQYVDLITPWRQMRLKALVSLAPLSECYSHRNSLEKSYSLKSECDRKFCEWQKERVMVS